MPISRPVLSPPAILFPKRADLICIFNQRARMIALVRPTIPLYLPPCLIPRPKLASEDLVFPLGEGDFRGKFDIRNFAHRLSPTESGGKRLLLVCFPRSLSTTISRPLLVTRSSQLASFPLFFFLFFFLSSFSPLLFYFRRSIERELASRELSHVRNFSPRPRERTIVSLDQPFDTRF